VVDIVLIVLNILGYNFLKNVPIGIKFGQNVYFEVLDRLEKKRNQKNENWGFSIVLLFSIV
tara:strand:+ start:209 stop:391 length:183 start_codon:yes stop_codon:yes gene_type:complete